MSNGPCTQHHFNWDLLPLPHSAGLLLRYRGRDAAEKGTKADLRMDEHVRDFRYLKTPQVQPKHQFFRSIFFSSYVYFFSRIAPQRRSRCRYRVLNTDNYCSLPSSPPVRRDGAPATFLSSIVRLHTNRLYQSL